MTAVDLKELKDKTEEEESSRKCCTLTVQHTELYNSRQHKLFIQVLQETAGWPPLTHESRTAGFNSSNYMLQSVRTPHACAVLL